MATYRGQNSGAARSIGGILTSARNCPGQIIMPAPVTTSTMLPTTSAMRRPLEPNAADISWRLCLRAWAPLMSATTILQSRDVHRGHSAHVSHLLAVHGGLGFGH